MRFLVLLAALVMAAPAISTALPAEDAPAARWTFMVYLDADNNLEEAGVEDLNEMETAGSTEDVNIVVLMDRAEGYDTSNGDWTDARLFYVTQDSTPDIASEELEDMGELNMGDPQTLINFTLWGIENYPAEHYALVIWDHGGAIWGAAWDDGVPDKEDGDFLSLPEIRRALWEVENTTSRNIDLLGFDACLMATVGVMYELRNHVDYAVASGYSEPGDGWPYERILPKLNANPEMSPLDLARIITDEYVDSYTDRQDDPQDSPAITMAVFDMKHMNELGGAVDLLGMNLALQTDWRPLKGRYFQISRARDETSSYDFSTSYLPGNQIPVDPTGYCFYDVIGLTENLQKYMPMDSGVIQAAENVKRAVSDTMVYARVNEYHSSVKGAHGMTVYFPDGRDTKYSNVFDGLELAKETFWDEFLGYFALKKSAADTPPALLISTPRDGQVLLRGTPQVVVEGSVAELQGQEVHLSYSVDGGDETALPPQGASWAFVLPLSDLEPGVHTVTVQASDGKYKEYREVSIYIVEKEGTTYSSSGGGGSALWPAVLALAVLAAVGFYMMKRSRRAT